MIQREMYLKQIRPFIDKPFIKVLTGIRRCGKSSLLMMVRDELLQSGIAVENIIYVNFENLDFAHLDIAEKLHKYVKARITGEGGSSHASGSDGSDRSDCSNRSGRYYVFLDEIQEVGHWERAVNSLYLDANVDLYITNRRHFWNTKSRQGLIRL